MGHTRIGRLNRTRKWKDIVGAFCMGAEAEQTSRMVLDAVSDAFNEKAIANDAGYQKAVELLVQMGVAAQSGDFVGHMRKCGINLSDTPTTQELMAHLDKSITDAMWKNYSGRCILGEHAKNALCHSVAICAKNERDQELPGLIDRPDVSVFNTFGTRANFAELNQNFIAQTIARGLNGYISQVLPNLTGVNLNILSMHEVNAAYEALTKHCVETATVHKAYSTEWLGKHNYQLKDMTPKTIKKHATFMVKKMMRALKYGKD